MDDSNYPAPNLQSAEFKRSRLAPLFYALYKLGKGHRRWSIAGIIFKFLKALEGGPGHSATVREILLRHHQVQIDAYSYGECLIPGAFPPKVVVGRWVSVGPGVRVYNQNHPLDHLSLHPYFYDPSMGVVKSCDMPRHTLFIGHDAWMGRNAIVTPGCKRIGIGAVIGAGAVVTKDVDDYAIVAGNPAKLIRYRFPDDIRKTLIASCWWTLNISDFTKLAQLMNQPVNEELLNHPLLRRAVAEATNRSTPETVSA